MTWKFLQVTYTCQAAGRGPGAAGQPVTSAREEEEEEEHEKEAGFVGRGRVQLLVSNFIKMQPAWETQTCLWNFTCVLMGTVRREVRLSSTLKGKTKPLSDRKFTSPDLPQSLNFLLILTSPYFRASEPIIKSLLRTLWEAATLLFLSLVTEEGIKQQLLLCKIRFFPKTSKPKKPIHAF